MRSIVVILAAALAAGSFSAQAQKLYRWTDKDGKVHYSDHIPPEAVERAHEQLNKQGMTVDRVERAMTPEERAEAEARAKALAAERKRQEDQDAADAILLGSYSTEADLKRSYDERFDLINQSIESARIGVKSQEKSQAELTAHAASLEAQGKPVPDSIKNSLQLSRKQVQEQREYLAKREAEKAVLQQEFDSLLIRFRELKAKQAGASAR